MGRRRNSQFGRRRPDAELEKRTGKDEVTVAQVTAAAAAAESESVVRSQEINCCLDRSAAAQPLGCAAVTAERASEEVPHRSGFQ